MANLSEIAAVAQNVAKFIYEILSFNIKDPIFPAAGLTTMTGSNRYGWQILS